MLFHKPHEPDHDRLKAIKHGLRQRLEVEREVKLAAERHAVETARLAEAQAAEAARQAEAKAKAEAVQQAEAEAARQAHKPWRETHFTLTDAHAATAESESEPAKPDDKSADSVEKGLEAIYMERDGALPDMTAFERKRSRFWLRAFLSLSGFAGLLSVAAWTGAFLIQPLRGFHGQGLQLALQGSSEIALGREETYHLTWTNPDDQPLANARVRLSLPPDFLQTDLTPPPTDPSLPEWDLGFVSPKSSGEIVLKGVFRGALGAQQALQAIGTYQPSGFTRSNDTLATLPVLYKETALEGQATLPPKILPGDLVTLRYHLANHGTHPTPGLLVHIKYPPGFMPSQMASSSQTEATLPLGELVPNASTTLQLTGMFASGMAGDAAFEMDAGYPGSDGAFLAMQHTEAHTSVLAGDLTLHVVVNGADTDRTILPGDPLRLSLAYQNTSPEPIKGVVLVLGFESIVNGKSTTGTSLLDWSRLEDHTQGVSTTAAQIQTIRYDKQQVATFDQLVPQAEGTIDLTIPTLNLVTSTKDAAIRVTLLGMVEDVGNLKVARVVRAQPIVMRERSDLDLAASAHYFTEEGAPVGFGPLPPVVGQTTAYRVSWQLHKQLHEVDNITVSAVLPKIAAWSNKTIVDAGTMSYDESTRTVTWTLNNLPQTVSDLEADFEVQLTPGPNDEGRFADLLGESHLQAQDPVVNELIMKTKPALTSDLQEDEAASGKGVVRKP